MSDVKPNDRVRCTLGDNVIVGKVMGPVTDTHLSLIYGNAKYARLDRATWKVEVLGPDNYPTQPGLYEVTWENGVPSMCNPMTVRSDGSLLTECCGVIEKPVEHHRRATWKRLPDPLPPEPPEGTVLRDRHGFLWWRGMSRWWRSGSGTPWSWEMAQPHAPFTRLAPAPDPDDEQQVEALADAIASAEASEIRPGYRDMARAALTFLRDGGAR